MLNEARISRFALYGAVFGASAALIVRPEYSWWQGLLGAAVLHGVGYLIYRYLDRSVWPEALTGVGLAIVGLQEGLGLWLIPNSVVTLFTLTAVSAVGFDQLERLDSVALNAVGAYYISRLIKNHVTWNN